MWKDWGCLICKMSIVIEDFLGINATFRMLLFSESTWNPMGFASEHSNPVSWFFFSFFFFAYALAVEAYNSFSSLKDKTQKLLTALTHDPPREKRKKKITFGKRFLEGNSQKMKLKLIKLWSCALSFSNAKSTGILA